VSILGLIFQVLDLRYSRRVEIARMRRKSKVKIKMVGSSLA
jgi:hypothetical protein